MIDFNIYTWCAWIITLSISFLLGYYYGIAKSKIIEKAFDKFT